MAATYEEKGFQGSLDSVNFYRRFIYNAAKLQVLLYELTAQIKNRDVPLVLTDQTRNKLFR